MYPLASWYRRYAEVCASTDYGDAESVNRHNEAVEGMYRVVREANAASQADMTSLISLLNDPIAGKWIAHHLLECVDVSPDVEENCLVVIRRIAELNQVDGLGERLWLKSYRSRRTSI